MAGGSERNRMNRSGRRTWVYDLSAYREEISFCELVILSRVFRNYLGTQSVVRAAF